MVRHNFPFSAIQFLPELIHLHFKTKSNEQRKEEKKDYMTKNVLINCKYNLQDYTYLYKKPTHTTCIFE